MATPSKSSDSKKSAPAPVTVHYEQTATGQYRAVTKTQAGVTTTIGTAGGRTVSGGGVKIEKTSEYLYKTGQAPITREAYIARAAKGETAPAWAVKEATRREQLTIKGRTEAAKRAELEKPEEVKKLEPTKVTTREEFAKRLFGLQKRKVTKEDRGIIEVETREPGRKETISLPTGRVIAEVPVSAKVYPAFIPAYEKKVAREKLKAPSTKTREVAIKSLERAGVAFKEHPAGLEVDIGGGRKQIISFERRDLRRGTEVLAEIPTSATYQRLGAYERQLPMIAERRRVMEMPLKEPAFDEFRTFPTSIGMGRIKFEQMEKEKMALGEQISIEHSAIMQRRKAIDIKARKKTGIKLFGAAVAVGALGTAYEFTRRPLRTTAELGAVSVFTATMPYVAIPLMAGAVGVSATTKVISGRTPLFAIGETAGEIAPYVAVGFGARGKSITTRLIKGGRYEVGKLKGIYETEGLRVVAGKLAKEKFTQPLIESYTRRFRKPPKPSKEFLISYKQKILGQPSPIEITQRMARGFAIVEKGKAGKVTTKKIGFPEVEIGKTEFAAPRTLLPFEPLAAVKIPTYKTVAVKGYKITKLKTRLVAEDTSIGITESGKVISGLKGISRIKETAYTFKTKVEVEPHTRYLKRTLEIKAAKGKPAEPSPRLIGEPLGREDFVRVFQTSQLAGKPTKKAKLPEELRFEYFPEKRGRPIKVTPGYVKMLKSKRAELILESQRQRQKSIMERAGKIGDVWEVRALESRIYPTFMVESRAGTMALPVSMQRQISQQRLFQKPTLEIKQIGKAKTIFDVMLKPAQIQKTFQVVSPKSMQKVGAVSRLDLMQKQVPELKQRQRPKPIPEDPFKETPITFKFKLPEWESLKRKKRKGKFKGDRLFKYQAGLREIMTGITAKKAPKGVFGGLFTGLEARPVIIGENWVKRKPIKKKKK